MLNNSAIKLNNLRKTFVNYHINGFIFTTTDEYINEYVPNYAKRLEYLTDFTGSVALVIVLENKAAIFVDGRYTLQVKEEVDNNLYDILSYNLNNINTWLQNNAKGLTIAINLKVVSCQELNMYENIFKQHDIKSSYISTHLVDEIWEEQPNIPNNLVIDYDVAYSGIGYKEKLQSLAEHLQTQNINYTLITGLDSIAWLLNIRGSDVYGSPLALAQCLVDSEGNCTLFLVSDNIAPKVQAKDITILTSGDLEKHLDSISALNKTISISKNTPAYFLNLLKQKGFVVKIEDDFCYQQKAIKNQVEIKSMVNAHIKDGVALTKLLYHLDSNIDKIVYNEHTIDDKLAEYRQQVDTNIFKSNSYAGCSFPSIVGADGNGAIVHYRAKVKTAKTITPQSYLLIDCGAQYMDGTTDVTRTISFKKQDDTFKKHFTLVLKGHIAIAKAKIKYGAKGCHLDILARQFLWQENLDYAHGTGHGVGCFLNVHEGPISISSLNDTIVQAGMIISNEPGYYLENSYGIRLENLLVVKQDTDDGVKSQSFLKFEDLTMVPFDMKNVLSNLLDDTEKQWINNYHHKVYANLKAYLSEEEKDWFKIYTAIV